MSDWKKRIFDKYFELFATLDEYRDTLSAEILEEMQHDLFRQYQIEFDLEARENAIKDKQRRYRISVMESMMIPGKTRSIFFWKRKPNEAAQLTIREIDQEWQEYCIERAKELDREGDLLIGMAAQILSENGYRVIAEEEGLENASEMPQNGADEPAGEEAEAPEGSAEGATEAPEEPDVAEIWDEEYDEAPDEPAGEEPDEAEGAATEPGEAISS